MKKMNATKKLLISSIASLLLAIVALGSVSFAWFSMNKETTSDGMQLKVEATENLIISNSTTEIAKTDLNSINTDSPFVVTFATNNDTYKPATHDSTYATFPAGLKFVTNPQDVDPTTGVAKSGQTLNVSGVVTNVNPSGNPSSQDYYVDFIIYIASFAKEMTDVKLKAQIISATKNAVEVTSGSLMATSIDFYAGTSVSAASFRGTLNVANKASSLYLFNTSGNVDDVPYNQDVYLTFVLRCYFDGALSSGGTAYINTATLDTSTVSLTVKFFIED